MEYIFTAFCASLLFTALVSALAPLRMATKVASTGASKKHPHESIAVGEEGSILLPLPPLPEEDPKIPPTTLLDDLPPYVVGDYRVPKQWQYIRTHFRTGGKYHKIFNFRIKEQMTLKLVHSMIRVVFDQMRTCFHLNLSFGFIAMNSRTEDVRYVYASQNTEFFDAPKYIDGEESLENAFIDLDSRDVLDWAKDQLPSSRFIVLRFTNVLITADKVPGAPIF